MKQVTWERHVKAEGVKLAQTCSLGTLLSQLLNLSYCCVEQDSRLSLKFLVEQLLIGLFGSFFWGLGHHVGEMVIKFTLKTSLIAESPLVSFLEQDMQF